MRAWGVSRVAAGETPGAGMRNFPKNMLASCAEALAEGGRAARGLSRCEVPRGANLVTKIS